MKVGRLRHRIKLQTSGETHDPDTGEMTGGGWADTVTGEPADIAPMSGREFVAAAALQTRVTTRITIRYRDGVNTKMRAIDEATGKVYGIEAVLPDPKSGREYLTLMCSEGEEQ